MWIVDDSKELNNMVSTMISHTVDGGSPAEKSQLLDPPFIKKLGALKHNREVIAVAINAYMMNNVEHVRHTAT